MDAGRDRRECEDLSTSKDRNAAGTQYTDDQTPIRLLEVKYIDVRTTGEEIDSGDII
jgi:hypothetical protein